MKLYMMIETRKDKLSEEEQEQLCWDLMEGSDAYNIVARDSMEKLNYALKEENE